MLIGASLRLWQYLANSSLWIDELALTRNIVDRSLRGLWQPLDYAQAAPFGFLVVEKVLTGAFGAGEFVLRAFPLMCGIASLFIFWALCKRILTGWSVPYAMGLLALGIPFIYFSSQVKQYSSDVAASLLLTLIAVELLRGGHSAHNLFGFGVVGALIAWMSQPAFFVVAGVTVALLLTVTRSKTAAPQSLMVASVWLVSTAAAAAHAMASVSDVDRHYFRWFWGEGFMRIPFQGISDALWLPNKLIWVFGAFGPGLGHTNGGMNYRWSPVFAAMMLYGFWTLCRKQRDAALVLIFPVVIAVGFSAAGLYPFTARLLAFLIPFFLIATAAGANALLTGLPARLQFLNPIAMAILGGAPIYAIATALPPSWVQHFRPVMAHVADRLRPGDRIYVYSGAALAFSYYAPRFNVPRAAAVQGRCALSDPRAYLRELDALRGEDRVWVLATHEQRAGELKLFLDYLDTLGQRNDEITVPASNGRAIEAAHGYLYDLGRSDRVDPNLAEAFPLPPALTPLSETAARWGCYGITGGEPSR